MGQATGLIFNIQKYSVHDGPGVRTIAFFKGCPLRCVWCSNPESQTSHEQLAFNATRCLKDKCLACKTICPHGAISFSSDALPAIDRTTCNDRECDRHCAARCHAGALSVFGRKATVEEILTEVQKDAVFYQRSSGGLTLSGGEPTAQPGFLLALLEEAEKKYINTAMETCGYAPYDVLREAAAHLDTLIFDIKHVDPAAHKKGTGVDNAPIIDNLKKLSRELADLPILVRTPVIPGFNDSEAVINAICDLVASLPGRQISYEMLPYHRLGTQKYAQLGREYLMGDAKLDKKRMNALKILATRKLGERLVN